MIPVQSFRESLRRCDSHAKFLWITEMTVLWMTRMLPRITEMTDVLWMTRVLPRITEMTDVLWMTRVLPRITKVL